MLLAGCATDPIATEKAATVPPHRVLTQQWREEAPNTGTVIIKRDAGSMGAACGVDVFIDAIRAADMRASEKTVFYLPEGEHLISAAHGTLCGGGTSEVSILIESAKTKTFRISIGSGGDLALQPTAF